MDEELPFENEPVPAVAMSLSQSAMYGHFNNKNCLKKLSMRSGPKLFCPGINRHVSLVKAEFHFTCSLDCWIV